MARPKGEGILLQDGLPTALGSFRQRLRAGPVNPGVAQHGIILLTLAQRQQINLLLDKAQAFFILLMLDLSGQ